MATPFTHTTWQVKPGQEDEFVRRWKEWANWSRRQGLRAQARLLRDIETPGTFISFGPWETMAAVRSWRSGAGCQERVARLRELVERFEPRTLELVAAKLPQLRTSTRRGGLFGLRGARSVARQFNSERYGSGSEI